MSPVALHEVTYFRVQYAVSKMHRDPGFMKHGAITLTTRHFLYLSCRYALEPAYQNGRRHLGNSGDTSGAELAWPWSGFTATTPPTSEFSAGGANRRYQRHGADQLNQHHPGTLLLSVSHSGARKNIFSGPYHDLMSFSRRRDRRRVGKGI